jgi:3-hydroxyisobutyrate dehydrogenase
MGAAAARRLLEKGYRVTVWNRTADRATPLVEQGVEAANSPGEAAAGAGVVITSLAHDAALERVALGPE